MFAQRLWGVVSAVVVGLVLVAALGVGLLYQQGLRPFVVQTASMQPTLAPGELVMVKRAGLYSEGSMVTYHSTFLGGELVTHRIVHVDRLHEVVVTQGDALGQPDQPIRPGQIIGVVRWHIPAVGRWFGALRRPWFLLVGLYMPCLLIIGCELQRLSSLRATGQRYNHGGSAERG